LGPEATPPCVFLLGRVPKNVPHFLFHAVSVPPGEPLKSRLHFGVEISNYKLCHKMPPYKVMIA
jgi:hypothetical protein